MTEKHVTLKTAVLLKEKGFPQDKWPVSVVDLPCRFKYLSIPPQSVAQKWLRETKNLHITIYNCASGYTYDISKADMGTVLFCFPKGPNDGGKWDTYEEALEDGILKSLKLI